MSLPEWIKAPLNLVFCSIINNDIISTAKAREPKEMYNCQER